MPLIIVRSVLAYVPVASQVCDTVSNSITLTLFVYTHIRLIVFLFVSTNIFPLVNSSIDSAENTPFLPFFEKRLASTISKNRIIALEDVARIASLSVGE